MCLLQLHILSTPAPLPQQHRHPLPVDDARLSNHPLTHSCNADDRAAAHISRRAATALLLCCCPCTLAQLATNQPLISPYDRRLSLNAESAADGGDAQPLVQQQQALTWKRHSTRAPAATPQRSAMRCIGTIADTRQCLFQSIYYHVPTERWHFFGTAGEGPKLYGHTPVDENEQWLRLGRYAITSAHGFLCSLSRPRSRASAQLHRRR